MSPSNLVSTNENIEKENPTECEPPQPPPENEQRLNLNQAVLLNQAAHQLDPDLIRIKLASRMAAKTIDPVNCTVGHYEIFVGDLSFFCTEMDLYELFCPFGQILKPRIRRSDRDSRTLMYGFVEISDRASAEKAVQALDGSMFQGRIIRVEISRCKAERNETFQLVQRQRALKKKSNDIQLHVLLSSQFPNQKVVKPKESLIRTIFEAYGTVRDVAIKEYVMHKESSRQEGFLFVSYTTMEDAMAAIEQLDKKNVNGFLFRCSLSHTSPHDSLANSSSSSSSLTNLGRPAKSASSLSNSSGSSPAIYGTSSSNSNSSPITIQQRVVLPIAAVNYSNKNPPPMQYQPSYGGATANMYAQASSMQNMQPSMIHQHSSSHQIPPNGYLVGQCPQYLGVPAVGYPYQSNSSSSSSNNNNNNHQAAIPSRVAGYYGYSGPVSHQIVPFSMNQQVAYQSGSASYPTSSQYHALQHNSSLSSASDRRYPLTLYRP